MLLNHHAPRDVAYKVLYLARHGQGQHNVAGRSSPPPSILTSQS